MGDKTNENIVYSEQHKVTVGNYDIGGKKIYGDFNGTPQRGCFISVRTWSDNNHISIDLADNGCHTIWNFDVKHKEYIEDIKNSIISICDLVDAIYGFDMNTNIAEAQIDRMFDEKSDEWFEEKEPEVIEERRSKEEIYEYMEEAFDRVWLVRKQDLCCNLLDGTESIHIDVMNGMLKAIDDTCKEYNIDFKEPVSDWDYGYWSGILAALRWVMGEEKDMLDT